MMIGGYPDKNTAHTALLYVKKLAPPDLKVPEGTPRAVRRRRQRPRRGQIHQPLQCSKHVVRNPSIPRETHVMQPKDDPFLKTLNADEEYSMLRCPGKWDAAGGEGADRGQLVQPLFQNLGAGVGDIVPSYHDTLDLTGQVVPVVSVAKELNVQFE